MLEKCTHFQVIMQQSTQTQQTAVTDIRKKPVDFFNNTEVVNFSARNNFQNSGSFAKVSISVKIYNFLIQLEGQLKLYSQYASNSNFRGS